MKLQWETPRIEIEAFEANEYVSVCYSISCQVGSQGFSTTYDGTYYNDSSLWGSFNTQGRTEATWGQPSTPQNAHDSSGTSGTCSDPASNYITVNADGSYSFYEANNQQGNLSGVITKAVDGSNTASGIGAGDLIAWVTYNTKNYWRHWAIAEASDASHPNRS